MDILNMIKNYLLVTWQRLKSNSPRYWKRFFWISTMVSALSAFLTEYDAIIPEKYKWISTHVAALAAGMALVSKFTTANEIIAQKSEDILLKENADKKLDSI